MPTRTALMARSRPRTSASLASLLVALVAVSGLAPSAADAQVLRRNGAAAAAAQPPRAAEPVIVVMSGTFDPVHDGHLSVMRAARDFYRAQGRPVRVIAVPNPENPLKTPVNVNDRLELLRRSLADTDHVDIGVPEGREWQAVQRGGARELLRYLSRASGPGTRLVRVYGADSFEANRERGVVDELLHNGVEVLVADRPGYAPSQALPRGVNRLNVVGGTSSTQIRAALARGQRPAGLRRPALRYIQQRGLYGVPRAGGNAGGASRLFNTLSRPRR